MKWLKNLIAFFKGLKNRPSKQLKNNLDFLYSQDSKMEWLRKHHYKIQLPLDVFANLHTITKGMHQEDIRRFGLSQYYGFDVYSFITGKTLLETIEKNKHWIEFTEKSH